MPTTAPADAPPVVAFESITDPIERLAALTRLAKVMGHRFPREHAACRRVAARQARLLRHEDGRPYSLAFIGGKVGLHLTRIRQLLLAGADGATS